MAVGGSIAAGLVDRDEGRQRCWGLAKEVSVVGSGGVGKRRKRRFVFIYIYIYIYYCIYIIIIYMYIFIYTTSGPKYRT